MIYSLARAINLFFNVLIWLIIIRSLSTIIIRDYKSPILRVLYEVTEPILMPIRNLMGRLNINTGMIDFSPFLAIVALNIFRNFILNIVF